jgi:membrane fusion protein, heavy metal efflux system
MKPHLYFVSIAIILSACSSKNKKQVQAFSAPEIKNAGMLIHFPDTAGIAFFETETVGNGNISAALTAPAKVAATVMTSAEGAGRNIVLFESPELASNYTQLIQHQLNIVQKRNIIEQKKSIISQKQAIIRQKQIEVDRYKDLAAHGAGTGKDVADAQTDLLAAQTELTAAETELRIAQNELANEQTSIIEHEAALKTGGFNPKVLLQAPAGTAYIICDVSENQLSNIKEGSSCSIRFTAYPGENYKGIIEDVADVVDNITRMVKLRISLPNTAARLRSGMFAEVSFTLQDMHTMSVNKSALATVQGKNYVFVKKPAGIFERREVQAGQQVGARVVVFGGITPGEAVVVQGVMQLKGLSFGY